jgi:tol-pal system protein YbgF
MSEYASQVNKQILTVIVALMISGATFAQVQVVDAANSDGNQPAQNSQNNTANTTAGPSNNNDIVVTLYNMLEALQQEVQMLRGMVEEQGYQIRRMETEQRDRYLDVDNRLSALNQRINQGTVVNNGGLPGGAPATGVNVGNNTLPGPAANQPNLPQRTNVPNPSQNGSAAPLPTQTGNSGATLALNQGRPQALTEEELYQEARNLLLNDADYEGSISVFQQMIESYPQGRLAPNAFYWQGEALILVERYSQAINVFSEVIDNFSTHEKAPDSMLKLGIVYSLMDNERRARQVWQQVLSDYANSGSGSLRLAEVYLRNGYNR